MNTVWCNGSFDVIHYGHFKLLEYASSLGTLHVGLDSSRRIKEKKGEDRPFHTWEQRKNILLGFRFVHEVYYFDTDNELKYWMEKISPDFMVIGGDYRDKTIIGREFVKEIVYFDRIGQLSTTNILKQWDTEKTQR